MRDRSRILYAMNVLSAERRTAVIQALCEGNSIRATCRLTSTAKGTVLRLLEEVGLACAAFHDRTVRGIKAKRVQCDEIWSFTYAKDRNLPPELRGKPGFGDTWTWMAMDADTKLVISWLVGDRGAGEASCLMRDLAARLANRVQLTTDAHNAYLRGVEDGFGWQGVDYSQLVKVYASSRGAGQRYSPPHIVATYRAASMGHPDPKHVSTSYVERQNLTMRMQMRRFTRLTNAFSKKLANHRHAVALYVMHYNFCRAHQALTKAAHGVYQTPAMAAGLTNRVWNPLDLVALLQAERSQSAGAA